MSSNLFFIIHNFRNYLPRCLDCYSNAGCGPLPWGLEGTLGPCKQRSCTQKHCHLFGCIYLFLCLVASQLLVCWSNFLQLGIGYSSRQGSIPASQIDGWCCLFIYKNLAFSVLILGWLLYFAWRTPSLGGWLVWWGWGEAWGVDSVVLCWHRNRVCQNSVSHLVFSHPSILVVFSKLC